MLLDKQLISSLRYVHGLFNLVVMLLFFIQGFYGLKIRSARLANNSAPVTIIKRHRFLGPLLSVLAITGFFAGLVLVYIDHENILQYPLHLFFGVVLAVFLLNVVIISRKIKGPDPHWRNLHYRFGVVVLCVYVIQSLLGIGILL